MSQQRRSRGGVLAAITGVTSLTAVVTVVLVTGVFESPVLESAEPSPSSAKDRGTKIAYHFDKTLCGAMDWSVVDPVAKIKDDIDAADRESRQAKTVSVECSVLLEGHPESQVYLSVTTYASVSDAENGHEPLVEQQRERVEDVTALDGDWKQGRLGTGHEVHEVYADALVQDSNAAGSVVLSLDGDSVTDAAAQSEAAGKVVAAIAKSMLDVLRRS